MLPAPPEKSTPPATAISQRTGPAREGSLGRMVVVPRCGRIMRPSGFRGDSMRPLTAVGAILVLTAAGRAADPPVDFARDVRPILAQHCWTCHGPDEKARQAKLRLDVRDEAVKKAIVPGNPK